MKRVIFFCHIKTTIRIFIVFGFVWVGFYNFRERSKDQSDSFASNLQKLAGEVFCLGPGWQISQKVATEAIIVGINFFLGALSQLGSLTEVVLVLDLLHQALYSTVFLHLLCNPSVQVVNSFVLLSLGPLVVIVHTLMVVVVALLMGLGLVLETPRVVASYVLTHP